MQRLRGDILFLGKVYLASDITLHMSLEDSFGNVVSGQLPSSKESTS
jgi:hypothetical protein